MRVTTHLKRPTRERCGPHLRVAPRAPLFGLAPGGVFRAADGYPPRGALLPHLFTLAGACALRRYVFCGTFRGLAPPRRYLAPCPVEPGLSSGLAPCDCPADSRGHYNGGVARAGKPAYFLPASSKARSYNWFFLRPVISAARA